MTLIASTFNVIDSHTAGHPTRVVLSGVPRLQGETVREQRDYFRAHHDELRGGLLQEPRGHAAMVGLVPVPSKVADFGAFFISSYVYLDMCGHGTIGYAKTLAFTGQLTREHGDSFTLETPAGVVTAYLVWADDGELLSVRLRNVPCFWGDEGLSIPFGEYGEVKADLIYGGMWYALVDASSMRLDLDPNNVSDLLAVGARLKAEIKKVISGRPQYEGRPAPSVLFYREDGPASSTHFLVLERNKFDRSPCGTGTSARYMQLVSQGKLNKNDAYHAHNLFGVEFTARYSGGSNAGQKEEMVVEVEGKAFITSTATILFEKEEPLSLGFLCR